MNYANYDAIEVTLNTKEDFKKWYWLFVAQKFDDGSTIDDLVFACVNEDGEEALDGKGKQEIIMYVEFYDDAWKQQIKDHARFASRTVTGKISIRDCRYDFENRRVVKYVVNA